MGITKSPAARLQRHVTCRRAGRAITRWIRSLQASGVQPQMLVQCEFPSRDKAHLAEMLIIKRMKEHGVALCNYVDIDHPVPPWVLRRRG